MNYNNLYTRMAREVSEVLNEHYFAHRVLPDTMQKNLVIKFEKPLFGESRNYAHEALDAAVSYVQTLVGLKHRPEFNIIDPLTATVKKSFADNEFARQ